MNKGAWCQAEYSVEHDENISKGEFETLTIKVQIGTTQALQDMAESMGVSVDWAADQAIVRGYYAVMDFSFQKKDLQAKG